MQWQMQYTVSHSRLCPASRAVSKNLSRPSSSHKEMVYLQLLHRVQRMDLASSPPCLCLDLAHLDFLFADEVYWTAALAAD